MPSRPTILNVDGDEMCRYAVTRILEHNDFRVREASSGAEALQIAEAEKPDLVLLDVNLPDINGFEVCRRLKAGPATARIPVLHVTASYARVPDMAKGLESGAESYLTEPVEPEVLVATIRAVLRTRHAENAAHRLAREWQITFDAIGDGLAVLDANGFIIRANESFARLYGRPVAELVRMPAYTLWGNPDEQRHPFFGAMQSRRREAAELEHESRILAITIDPILDDSGTPTGAVQIVSDITEERRLEEQFRESQKLETIGTLAAGVAHDFNNLLTSMMGNASLVIAELPEDSPHRERLEDVVRSSQRAADLTRQLLAYSGKARHVMQRVGLSDLVWRIRNLIESAVPKNIVLQMSLAPGLPAIEADTNQVQQIVLNLVSNAVEAIGEEAPGSLEIAAGVEGGSVYLEVRDSGCGMDAQTRARMFDPFFTTKFTGRGLGLAAVAGIARTHKATIDVTSSPGQGTTIRVSFPALQELPATRPEVKPERPQTRRAAGVVLVADDEEMVRRIAKATLEIRGYEVIVAQNGLEAIQHVRQHPEIEVVLLDLTMPVLGGAEAIDDILAAHPGVRVVVTTGYDQRQAAARFENKQVAGYLQKPYTSRQLSDKIRSVLEGE
jgi:PAS domain S-box-containing protein